MSETPTQRPNVLLIITDQHHAGIMGCAGDPVIQTPHLDALAARGVRFETAYCPFPLCCPSRMAFMTAQESHHIGVYGNADELRSDIPTFAHAAEVAGYETLLAGRMHFVGQDQRHGFRQRIISDVAGSAFIQHSYGLAPVLGDLSDTPGLNVKGVLKSGPGHSGYIQYDKSVTDASCHWLETRGNNAARDPFFMVVGYVSPHCPFVCEPEDFDRYASLISINDLPDDAPPIHPVNQAFRRRAKLEPPPPKEAQWRARVAYYGLTTFTDRCIGRVLQSLQQAGLADNTIVMYTSDHGESLGEHGLWWKCTHYDGSCRIPLIIADPRSTRRGSVSRSPVNLIDLGPTALDLIGAPALPHVDGRSLRPELELDDESVNPQTLTFAQNVPCTSDRAALTPSRMVRSRQYKYVYHHGLEGELFDMDNDPGETTNLINDVTPALAAVREQLHRAAMKGWDPEVVLRERLEAIDRTHMISRWIARVQPPEPDQPWFDGPQVNHVSLVTPAPPVPPNAGA